MILTGVALSNFKSINRGVIEDLAPLNVIFGPTNSGKSSILEAVYFQFHHQQFSHTEAYGEFLHSKADPQNATLQVETTWQCAEGIPALDLKMNDRLVCTSTVVFSGSVRTPEDTLSINGVAEKNTDRAQAAFRTLRGLVKFSSSRRPGDSKRTYFPGEEETPEQRRQRFLVALKELEIQGNHYQLFLSQLQRMFPHLVYQGASEQDIMDFFGTGFLGTAKLFVYLFDARYSLVLIDEPEIHFYPSLTRRFVRVLREVCASQKKQIVLSTHATSFLREPNLGNFYHIAKSRHYQTSLRRVDQLTLLEGLDVLNATPETVLQSDCIVYVEGPWDIGVLKEFLAKYPELTYTNIMVLHLGGGAMGNTNVDPVALKVHNPLSFILVDSERKKPGGVADPSHQDFMDRCHAAHLSCTMLERAAMENYFTPRALRVVFGDKIPARFENHSFRSLPAQGLRWYEKNMNARVAHAMTRDEIEQYPELKNFFHDLITVSEQLQ